MTTGFVLDASMAIAWHFQDEVTEVTLAIEELADSSMIIVPAHWHAEVANALLVGERRGRTDPEKVSRFLRHLGDLDLLIDDLQPEEHWRRVLPLARAHRLTLYDTFYLELAERSGLPLASLDHDLNEAAARIGIALLGGRA